VHTPLAWFSRFAFVSSVVGIAAFFGTMVATGDYWDWWRVSIGLPLHIALQPAVAPSDPPIIVEVHCSSVRSAAILRWNGTGISVESLPHTLRGLLAVRADHVVYIEGDGCLDLGDVERVVETVRDSWQGVRVVLLTPGTRRRLQSRP
jgi:hypothetical protein